MRRKKTKINKFNKYWKKNPVKGKAVNAEIKTIGFEESIYIKLKFYQCLIRKVYPKALVVSKGFGIQKALVDQRTKLGHGHHGAGH